MGLFSIIGNVIDTTLSYILKGFVALLKYALILGVLIIYGVYELAKGLLDYAKRAWKRIKERFPGAKGGSVTTIGGAAFNQALKDLKSRATIGQEISREELEEIDRIQEKIKSGEANAVNAMDGVDENGNETFLDVEFIKANGINQNEVYTRMIAKN